MEYFPDLDLDDEAQAALELLLSAYVESVVDVLAAAALQEPVASLCIYPGQDDGFDSLPIIYAHRLADRERIVRDGLADWLDVWNPFVYANEDDVIHPILRVVEDLVEQEHVDLPADAVTAWDVVREVLERRSVLDPTHWVHGLAARRLNRMSLPLPATADFAVWVFEFDEASSHDWVLEMLHAVLRPETFTALEGQGLVGRDPGAPDRSD